MPDFASICSFLGLVLLTQLVSCGSPQVRPKTTPPLHTQGGGRVAEGMLATHYDRDGNGKFEECKRGDTTFYDTNGDEQIDLEVVEGGDWDWDRLLKADFDFDGFLDQSVKLGCIVHSRLDIHEPASLLLRDDRRGPSQPLQSWGPTYNHWTCYFNKERQR